MSKHIFLVFFSFHHCVNCNDATILRDQALELGQKRGSQEMLGRWNSALILFKAHIHKDQIELILAVVHVLKSVANYRLDDSIIWSETEVFLAKVDKFLADVYGDQTS